MKHFEIFNKAYEKLSELYGERYHSLDIRVINRFYEEKKILQESELYIHFLEFVGRLREAAERNGEHVFVRGTAGSSLIAYLLGATNINPLPRHEYCPYCHTIKFIGEGTPFDRAPIKCSCGAEIIVDGHDIPFESNIKSVLREYIQLEVSYRFLDEAKRMICDDKWDKAMVVLENETVDTYALPRITLTPNRLLDQYRELEEATGVKMQDIGYRESETAFPCFMNGDFSGIPNFDNEFMRNLWSVVEPQSYHDLLKLLGLAHSTMVWNQNAEQLFANHRMSLREIPAHREDIYKIICERLRAKGIYETGFAYEVMEKARRGCYGKRGSADEDTTISLLNLGFDMDFVFLLEKIRYMFPKAHGVSYLKDAIAMMFYKVKFKDEFETIMKSTRKERLR